MAPPEKMRLYGHMRCSLSTFAAMTDDIISSHEVGMAKPDRRIYALTCERLNAQPHEVVFLDAAERSIIGARDCGMLAVLHRDAQQSIAEIEAHLAATS